MVDVAQYIDFAKYSQQSDALKNAKRLLFRGSVTVPDYVRILYIVRSVVQWRYGLNPSDPTLEKTSNYMFSLSGGRVVTETPTAPFMIIIQPQTQSVAEGGNVSFSVTVSGGTSPYTYQWYLNDSPLSGETDQTLDLTGVDSGDAGNYSVTITDQDGTVLTSNDATLTVILPTITGYLHYGDVDPATDLQSGIDNFTYQSSYPITHDAPISVTLSSTAANNKYLIIKVPSTESNKNNWYSTSFSNGTIPDFVFQSMVSFGGFDYYYTRNASSFEFTVPLILS